MALSGRINGSVTQNSNYFSFYLDWSATQNTSENSSTITVKTYWATNNIYQGFDTVGSSKLIAFSIGRGYVIFVGFLFCILKDIL